MVPACFWFPSKRLAGLQALLAVVAALGLLGSSLPQPAGAGLAIWCLAWALRQFGQNRTAAGYRRGLRYGRGAGWQLWTAAKGWQDIEIGAGSLVTWRLVVLRVRHPGHRVSKALLLPADVMDTQSHRRLRLWLRLTPLNGPAAGRFPLLRAAGRDNQG